MTLTEYISAKEIVCRDTIDQRDIGRKTILYLTDHGGRTRIISLPLDVSQFMLNFKNKMVCFSYAIAER